MASSNSVEVKSYRAVFLRLAEQAKREALTATATKIVGLAKQTVKRGATGNLSRAIGMTLPIKEGGFTSVGIGMHKGGEYGRWVEHGRKPGKMPPTDALIVWVQRVLKVKGRQLKSDRFLAGKRTGKAYRQIKRGRRLESDLRSIAFLVARAIKKRGIKPAPFLMPAYDAVMAGGGVGAELQRRLESLRSLMHE